MFQITHISAECFPIAKVGGLADVVGALPKYQNASGLEAAVIMPFYDNEFTKTQNLKIVLSKQLQLGESYYKYDILNAKKSLLGFELFVIKISGLTDRENVYGYDDDHKRFLAFQIVAMDYISSWKNKPSVIHCHDHHTGFIPFFTSYAYKYGALSKIPTVLTIHNAQYQGEFEYDKTHYLPEYNAAYSGILDWDGKINPLAAAIKCAWKVTTVSPAYLKEIQTHANGLEGLLAHENEKCEGILNGIDKEVWDTKTDARLFANYTVKTVTSGRKKNKKWICNEFDLDPKLPLVAFIGRFVYEKGSDLLAAVVKNVFDNLKLEVSVLILGSGDPTTTEELLALKDTYSGKYNCYIGYNEKLSHIIYGGADFLLMPSRVEPCGLNQMYALRYGMLPIVSNTGGLKDTIKDIDTGEEGFGIVCNDISVHEISFGIQRAVAVYENQPFFRKKRKQLMSIEHGWDKSAAAYTEMYKTLTSSSF